MFVSIQYCRTSSLTVIQYVRKLKKEDFYSYLSMDSRFSISAFKEWILICSVVGSQDCHAGPSGQDGTGLKSGVAPCFSKSRLVYDACRWAASQRPLSRILTRNFSRCAPSLLQLWSKEGCAVLDFIHDQGPNMNFWFISSEFTLDLNFD